MFSDDADEDEQEDFLDAAKQLVTSVRDAWYVRAYVAHDVGCDTYRHCCATQPTTFFLEASADLRRWLIQRKRVSSAASILLIR